MTQADYQTIVNVWQSIVDNFGKFAPSRDFGGFAAAVSSALDWLIANESTDQQKRYASGVKTWTNWIPGRSLEEIVIILPSMTTFMKSGYEGAIANASRVGLTPRVAASTSTPIARTMKMPSRISFPTTRSGEPAQDQMQPAPEEGLPGWVMPVAVLGAVALIGGVYWYMTRPQPMAV